MTGLTTANFPRRAFLAGASAFGLLALPGCSSFGGYSFTDAIARLLFLSSDRAFARMLDGGGFWDQQVAQLGLGQFLGGRGDVLSRILTSALFKNRLEDAFGDIAYEGAQRAAPLVADTIRVIGWDNAIDLVRGGPTAATSFLRQNMGSTLIEAMVPEVGGALRVASDPLVGQMLSALSGVDVSQVASGFSQRIDDVIWREIGVEEAAIRANPQATRDPLIIGVFGAGQAL
jgi:hypothetical protein